MDFSEYNEVVGAWLKEVLRNLGVDAELTLKYCRDIEEYARKNNDAKLLGFAYYYSGETYYVLNDGEKMFACISRAISYLDQSEQWELIARAYNLMAITSLNRGNAPIAMDYYLTALANCKKHGLYREANMIHLNLGTLYLSNGQYDEAQRYFEKVEGYIKEEQNTDLYYSLIACVCINLGRCCLNKGNHAKAKEYIAYVEEHCMNRLQKTELLYLLCFKAKYYHITGQEEFRDACISRIHDTFDVNMAIMDIFDDFYDLCRLLLEIEADDVFWDIMNILEKMTKSAGIVNLQRKIISLKIKYYRQHKDNAGYLQAAGLYYELTEVMERESQQMIAAMLEMRRSLERANAKRLEVERANVRLQEKSETDALTHLANRFRLNDYSEQALSRARQEQKGYAIEILDIDYFKEYNDNYGHQAGDECIMAIAAELKNMENSRIFCARYGGDEFIILYEGMSPEEVFAEAERLRERIVKKQIRHDYSKAVPVVTISQGICYDMPNEDHRNWDFLHVADGMLYEVKRKSRNNISMGKLDGTILLSGY